MTHRLRAVITVEYDAESNDYGTDEASAMAKIDETNWRDNPIALWETFDDTEFQIVVEPA